jgi:hypothetical protein
VHNEWAAVRRGLAFFVVSVPVVLVLALDGAGCVNAIGSDGTFTGLDGGAVISSALGQLPPPGACDPEAGALGGNCSGGAGTCCGLAQTTNAAICFYDGKATGVCTREPALSAGHTWTELYTDYFGGHGRAACAGNGTCHGDTSTASGGYQATMFECPPDDPATCYKTLKSAALVSVDAGTFAQTYLSTALRSVDCNVQQNPCDMPLDPIQVYEFTQTDVDRISAWVAEGAPND